jgi:hypothetical protein
MTTHPSENAPRCSEWSRAQQLDPVGSAGSYRGFLLIEVPLPWPRDIAESREVASISDLLTGRKIRVQALVPALSQRRVILYDNSDHRAFSGFTRRSAHVEGDVRATVAKLLDGDSGTNEGPLRDVLICTHGRRDRCCGSLGMRLSAELDVRAERPGSPLSGQAYRWRTSHTGGHRFAPTAIILPEATMWASVDADLIERLLERNGDVADVVERYRGCAGLESAEIQALEREVLREVGWRLLDCRRSGTDLGGGRYQLTVWNPQGRVDVWTGDVRVGRNLPLPECSRPLNSAVKSVVEFVVTGVTRQPG